MIFCPDEDRVGTRLSLRTGGFRYRVGRSRRRNHLSLDDPAVSAVHLEAVRVGDRVQVTDLGSTNGVLVRGLDIEAYRPQAVRDGDVIRLGTTSLCLRAPPDREVRPLSDLLSTGSGRRIRGGRSP